MAFPWRCKFTSDRYLSRLSREKISAKLAGSGYPPYSKGDYYLSYGVSGLRMRRPKLISTDRDIYLLTVFFGTAILREEMTIMGRTGAVDMRKVTVGVTAGKTGGISSLGDLKNIKLRDEGQPLYFLSISKPTNKETLKSNSKPPTASQLTG